MLTAIDAAELEAVRADVRELLDPTPAAGDARDGVALVEQLGLGLMVPFNLPHAPPELAAVVVEELERRGDPGAAGMLGAISVFAHEPLAGLACQALARLRERGVVSPVAEQIGALEVSELRRVAADDHAYYLIAILARPGSRRQQVASVRIAPDGDRELIADGLLTPPGKPASLRRFLRKEVGPGGSDISAVDALKRLRAAAEHMVAHELTASEGASAAVPLLARALCGDARALPNVSYELSDPVLDVDAADTGRTRATIEALLAEFGSFIAREHGDDSPLLAHIDLVWSMLDWKAHHADGRLAHWSVDDVHTFLLEFCPLAVPAGEQRIAVLPECVLAFLGFLEVIGRLKGPDSPDELQRAVTGARGRFEAEMRDIGAWGYAKSVAMEQFPEGIDPDERRLIDAWLTDSISPPSRERDATLGSVERLTRSPAASASTPNASKRAKRRSARHARKRNRR